jgi:hypothetical protein
MSSDFHPYFARKGDVISEERFTMGTESSILEFPVAWELDDFPYFQFLNKPIFQGLRLTEDVFSLWKAEFDCAHEESGLFTLTCHPEIIGRGPRVKMLDRLVEHMKSKDGVKFMTLADAVNEYK